MSLKNLTRSIENKLEKERVLLLKNKEELKSIINNNNGSIINLGSYVSRTIESEVKIKTLQEVLDTIDMYKWYTILVDKITDLKYWRKNEKRLR